MSCVSVSSLTSGNYEYEILNNGTAKITSYKGSATELIIPNRLDGYTVTRIGKSAFFGCKNLTEATIPDSVTSIGESAFCSCENITSITIPDSVTSIGDYAFYNCISLTNITIPASVTSIGERAFGKCKALVNIEVDINSFNYTSKDGNLYNKDTTKLILYALGKNVYSFTFPQSVTSIGSYAFEDCTILTNISIPDSVTSIGDGAFSRCASLKSITIPDSVTSIGDGTFGECKKLESITIPNSVTSIGNGAFYACYSLTNITIPYSVTSIGRSAFFRCSSLKRVLISNSVTSIGRSAFSRCSSLTSIAIPDSVTSIGDEAFYGCTKLYGAFVPIDLIDLNTNNIFPSTTKIYYIEKEFSINYDANGGIGAPEQLHFTSDTKTISFTVTKQIPSRTGYIFEGWSNEPNGSADYLPGNKYTISKSITLYAVWRERNTYTIKYKLCGGKGDIQNQIKTEGIDLKLSSIIPTHTNYIFAYWISSDKKTTYYSGSSYKADANDTLYAVWKETCSGCNGNQYSETTCRKCCGDGHITYTTDSCDSCNSTGKKTKTHTETCSQCEGLGVYYGYGFDANGNFGWGIIPCPRCNATGIIKVEEQVICTKCGGDGKADSFIKCSNCDGFGKIRTICDKCNGKNSIIYHYPNYETELDHDEDNPQLILGDANGDGTIDINDATCIQKHLAEYKNDDYIEEASDADGDGRVTIGDVTVIQQYLAEMLCPDGIGKPIG